MSIERPVCGAEGSGQVVFNAIKDLITNTDTSATKTVTLFGDSYTEYQRFTDAGNNYKNTTIQASCWAYLLSSLGNAVNVTNYAGVGGDTADVMLARLQADILDLPPTDYTFGQVGVNDFFRLGSPRNATDVFSDVQSIITQLINHGSKVLWLNCYAQPADRGGFSNTQSLYVAQYNKMLADWAEGIDGLIIVDVYNRSVDQFAATTGECRPNWYIGPDKVHLTIFGSWDTGQACLEALSPHLVPTSHSKGIAPNTTGDYGAVTQCNFNSTGGVNTTNGLGVVPDLWTLNRKSGAGTITGSHLPNGDYNLAINNSGGSSVYQLYTFNMKASFAGAGEIVKARLVYELDTGDLEVEELRAYLYMVNGTDFVTVEVGRSINGYETSPMIVGESVADILPTEMLAAPLTTVNFYIDIRVNGVATGNVILKNLRIEDA